MQTSAGTSVCFGHRLVGLKQKAPKKEDAQNDENRDDDDLD